MPDISVVIPTVTGRELSYARCVHAYRTRSDGATLELLTIKNAPTCGHAWLQAAKHAEGEYLHFTADDLEPHDDWWLPLVEACDRGTLPCPIVLNPDGSVQSAGGDLNEPACLLTTIGPDWTRVPFTTVPFLSRAQYDRIGMIPVHYFSDVWVSARGHQLGIETVLRPESRFTHHNEQAKRGAGMSQQARNEHDALRFQDYLEAAA